MNAKFFTNIPPQPPIVKFYIENTGGATYKCPTCHQVIPFPFHGNYLYCPLCHFNEPLYDYCISWNFYRHYTEYNLGPAKVAAL